MIAPFVYFKDTKSLTVTISVELRRTFHHSDRIRDSQNSQDFALGPENVAHDHEVPENFARFVRTVMAMQLAPLLDSYNQQ